MVIIVFKMYYLKQKISIFPVSTEKSRESRPTEVLFSRSLELSSLVETPIDVEITK